MSPFPIEDSELPCQVAVPQNGGSDVIILDSDESERDEMSREEEYAKRSDPDSNEESDDECQNGDHGSSAQPAVCDSSDILNTIFNANENFLNARLKKESPHTMKKSSVGIRHIFEPELRFDQ